MWVTVTVKALDTVQVREKRKKKKKSPRLSHSPLLEVNRTGSLLIVKSNSSNPPNDTQEQARAPAAPRQR